MASKDEEEPAGSHKPIYQDTHKNFYAGASFIERINKVAFGIMDGGYGPAYKLLSKSTYPNTVKNKNWMAIQLQYFGVPGFPRHPLQTK